MYIGKWHLSHVSPDQPDGLEPYGFSGWRGPEPHGANPKNSGLARDPGYVAQAVEWLQKRQDAHAEQVAAAAASAAAAVTSRTTAGEAASAAPPSSLPPLPLKPFLLVVCLVNPHDIVFWPSWWVPQLAVLATSAAAAVGGASWVLRRAAQTAGHHGRCGRSSSGSTGGGGGSRPPAQAVALAAAVVAAAAAVAWKGLKRVSLNCDEIDDPGPGPSDHDYSETCSDEAHPHLTDAQDAVNEQAKEEGDTLDVGGNLTSALLGESMSAGSVSTESSTSGSKASPPPPCQPREAPVIAQYRAQYPTAYGPAWVIRRVYEWRARSYRLTYATLLRRADHHLGQLLDALEQSLAATQELATTGVCFTADHGELLGAHGGLHQKWYGAFEEALRVPLLLKVPWLRSGAASGKDNVPGNRGASPSSCGTDGAHTSESPEQAVGRSRPTSHLDLMPTLLGLAGIDSSQGDNSKEQELNQLPGRDLLAEYREKVKEIKADSSDPARAHDDDETYFVTFDHVLDGDSKHGSAGRLWPIVGNHVYRMHYAGLTTPETAVEALVARLPDRAAAASTSPTAAASAEAAKATPPTRESTAGTTRTTKTITWKLVRSFNPAQRNLEGHLALFCLDRDPAERWNVAGCASPGSTLHAVEVEMRQRLAAARVRHGGPSCLGAEIKWAK